MAEQDHAVGQASLGREIVAHKVECNLLCPRACSLTMESAEASSSGDRKKRSFQKPVN